jgi:16S rRNA (cytosine1402-N4)-methyltransferase
MHRAVLLPEVVRLLAPRPGGVYVDGTLGGGGHTRAILEAAGDGVRLLALDRDADALERARQALGEKARFCTFVQANFADVAGTARAHGFDAVDGIVLDVGVSSYQLDDPERGFSFMRDGPLDMRMDRTQTTTAADLVNTRPAVELAALFRAYGEEPRARAIAVRIEARRRTAPFARTSELAMLVSDLYGGRRERLHPATRVFQALRIAVNGELTALSAGLEGGLELLRPGGRMAVIAFHSLEDRIVKQCFAEHEGRWAGRPEGGQTWVGRLPAVTRLTRKPVVPGDEECASNPRARSAKLRAVERKEDDHGTA